MRLILQIFLLSALASSAFGSLLGWLCTKVQTKLWKDPRPTCDICHRHTSSLTPVGARRRTLRLPEDRTEFGQEKNDGHLLKINETDVTTMPQSEQREYLDSVCAEERPFTITFSTTNPDDFVPTTNSAGIALRQCMNMEKCYKEQGREENIPHPTGQIRFISAFKLKDGTNAIATKPKACYVCNETDYKKLYVDEENRVRCLKRRTCLRVNFQNTAAEHAEYREKTRGVREKNKNKTGFGKSRSDLRAERAEMEYGTGKCPEPTYDFYGNREW